MLLKGTKYKYIQKCLNFFFFCKRLLKKYGHCFWKDTLLFIFFKGHFLCGLSSTKKFHSSPLLRSGSRCVRSVWADSTSGKKVVRKICICDLLTFKFLPASKRVVEQLLAAQGDQLPPEEMQRLLCKEIGNIENLNYVPILVLT